MREISISLWELSKDEASRLPDGTATLIFNPVTSDYKIEYSGKRSSANDKHACSNLKYFTFEAPKLRRTVYFIKGQDIGEEPDCPGGYIENGPYLDLSDAQETMYLMSEELTLAGQHIYSGLYIDSREIYI